MSMDYGRKWRDGGREFNKPAASNLWHTRTDAERAVLAKLEQREHRRPEAELAKAIRAAAARDGCTPDDALRRALFKVERRAAITALSDAQLRVQQTGLAGRPQPMRPPAATLPIAPQDRGNAGITAKPVDTAVRTGDPRHDPAEALRLIDEGLLRQHQPMLGEHR